jgi:hypothetical protein
MFNPFVLEQCQLLLEASSRALFSQSKRRTLEGSTITIAFRKMTLRELSISAGGNEVGDEEDADHLRGEGGRVERPDVHP